VSVEQAELAAQQARAALAETLLGRMERASLKSGASEPTSTAPRPSSTSRAPSGAHAGVIDRKTIRAPFRARVGLADLHPGQYLTEGSVLTTLQGLDEAVHIDSPCRRAWRPACARASASRSPRRGTPSRSRPRSSRSTRASIPRRATRSCARASRTSSPQPAPGTSARMSVPIGAPRNVLTVPVSALRKGPRATTSSSSSPTPKGIRARTCATSSPGWCWARRS
jgi:membrane fusion protein (multidrug efflux system)